MLKKPIADPQLRRQVGESGRKRTLAEYDWTVIYRRYQTRWDELAERRRADPDLYPPIGTTARPDRADPFAVFAGDATTQIGMQHVVTLREEGLELALRRALALNAFAQKLQPDAEECAAIASFLGERGPQPVSGIAELFPGTPAWQLQRSLAWPAKMEVLQIDAP